MKRSQPLKRSGRLKPFSAKRDAIRPDRRALVERLLRERPTCEGLFYLRAIVNVVDGADRVSVLEAMKACSLRSTEVHEVLSRARGGSILDEDNTKCLCHFCHGWVTTHPRLASLAGLMVSRWQR